MLIDDAVVHVDVPHAEGEWVEFVRPLRKILRKARRAKQKEGRKSSRELVEGLDGSAVEAIIRSANEQGEEDTSADPTATRQAPDTLDTRLLGSS